MWRRADHIAAEIYIDTFQKCEQGHDDMNSESQEAMRILKLQLETKGILISECEIAGGGLEYSLLTFISQSVDGEIKYKTLSKGETLEEAIIRLEKPYYRRPVHKDIGNGRAAKAVKVEMPK